jgi:hypothetical protein
VTDHSLDLRILDALAQGATTPAEVATALGQSESAIDGSIRWAVGQGYVTAAQTPDGIALRLTPPGSTVANMRRGIVGLGTGQGGVTDLVAQISQGWAEGQSEAAQQDRAAQAHLLVSDGERDAAVETLSRSYDESRIDLAELERRTGVALSARTRGDLAQALENLPAVSGPAHPPAMLTWLGRLPALRRLLGVVITALLVAGVLVVAWNSR